MDTMRVLLVLANLEKAFTYCSATLSAAAFSPLLSLNLSAINCIPFALASALAIMALASPEVRLNN